MGLIPDVGQAIRQTIFGDGGGTIAPAARVPMLFTSTRRLRLFSPGFSSEERVVASDLVELTQNGALVGQSEIDMPIIQMAVNPNTIRWRQPKRIVKRDTREGSVYFHFTNSKGQNNDILTLEFSGNTGNIDIRGDNNSARSATGNPNSPGVGSVRRQLVWHNLWNLTREPMVFTDTNGTSINVFQIIYASPIIPVQISLLGFFSTVLEWTDSADKPFSKDYSFGFTVQDTTPPLDDILAELQSAVFDPATTQTT